MEHKEYNDNKKYKICFKHTNHHKHQERTVKKNEQN